MNWGCLFLRLFSQVKTCFQCHKLMTWGSFFKHTALREIKLICIPSHQHYQTSPWTFTLDLLYGPLMLLPFYMNRWLYDQESCLPSGLVYSDMPHIRDVQISLIRTHNIPLNQLMFVWSSFFCSRLCFLPKSLEKVTLRWGSSSLRQMEGDAPGDGGICAPLFSMLY